jgi:hypothetical protein
MASTAIHIIEAKNTDRLRFFELDHSPTHVLATVTANTVGELPFSTLGARNKVWSRQAVMRTPFVPL